MICTTTTSPKAARDEFYGVPSADRIRQLAAEIRKTWSPKTRARRAAQGCRRVELMIFSAFELSKLDAACED